MSTPHYLLFQTKSRPSERQVVGRTFGRSSKGILLGSWGCGLCGRSGLRSGCITGRSGSRLGSNRCGIDLTHIEGTDAVEPTAIIFMGIDVERNIHLLTNLNIETLQTLGAKHFKHHLAGISLVSLDYITFNFPFTTC